MSPVVQFDEKGLLRGKPIVPGWYVVRIDAIGEKLSKDQGSTNFPVEGTIIKNADDGSETFANYPLEWNFNSKAMGFSVGFLESCGVKVEAGKRYELSALAGESLEVFVENAEYEGRIVNRVNHKYRPLRAA